MGQFVLELEAFVKNAGGNAEEVVRKIGIQIHSSVIMKTPVDLGRARGNWTITVGSPDRTQKARTDLRPFGEKPGMALAMEAQTVLEKFKLGETIWLTNSLPYARRLEYGWSDQAPQGMVRLTISEWQAFIAKAVKELK